MLHLSQIVRLKLACVFLPFFVWLISETTILGHEKFEVSVSQRYWLLQFFGINTFSERLLHANFNITWLTGLEKYLFIMKLSEWQLLFMIYLWGSFAVVQLFPVWTNW